MEGPARYQQQLDAAIETRRQWLEAEQIPRLKDALASFEALFEGAVGMLIRKGHLREDPYNYEQTFSDITIPKDDALPEFENSDEVSYRLAAYRRQLKYVSTDYPFDVPTMSLARLKKLSSLLSYINWLEMGESSKSPTTKAFARAFMKVRMGTDTMASQILKDSELQIVKSTHQIRALLADLMAWCRESWKADIRRLVLPALAAGSAEGHTRREEMLKGIRRVFANRMEGKPWYLSRTIWGLVIAAAGLIVGHWHIQLPDETTDTVVQAACNIADAVGLLLALYGRVRASGPITLTNPSKP